MYSRKKKATEKRSNEEKKIGEVAIRKEKRKELLNKEQRREGCAKSLKECQNDGKGLLQ